MTRGPVNDADPVAGCQDRGPQGSRAFALRVQMVPLGKSQKETVVREEWQFAQVNL